MPSRRHTVALLAALSVAAIFALAACGDDSGGGEAARKSAADLQANLENFQRDLAGIANIEEAPANLKDGLKDSCSKLQDEINSETLDDFCANLGDAIDAENQTDYQALKGRVATDVVDQFREEIANRLRNAGDQGGN